MNIILPTVRQLQYFVTLAETGHYRKAAEKVGISQPSLSLQISNLEKTLQLKLLERGRTGATLTPEGRDVLERARAILGDVIELWETSERLKGGLAGTIRLGSSPTLGPYLLPNVLRELHQRHPALRLLIRDGAPFDLLDDLLAGQHDLILTQLPVPSSDVTVLRLLREPLHLAVAREHRLAQQSAANDHDLVDETVLVLSNRFALYDQIAELTQVVGGQVLRDYEGTSLDAVRQMTAMNMGVAFLPALYAQSEVPKTGGDVALLPFRNGQFTRSIGLVWRRSSGHHAAFEAFAEVIRDVSRTHFKGLVTIEG